MKHRVSLPSFMRDLLAEIPETSMGAQRLDICLFNGRIIPEVSIYNGEDAMVEEPLDVNQIVAFREKNGKIWKLKRR